MIQGVRIRNFKRFQDNTFKLADSVVLAGPNNSGKTTLLQAIATGKLGLDRWVAHRSGGKAVRRSAVSIPRTDIAAVPLREMNLLWEDRRVSGPEGMSGTPRLIEIEIEGRTNGETWTCGIEFQYANRELVYARPMGGKNLGAEAIRCFPPEPARQIEIVHIPPLSGVERDEPRRERGMQDLLIGQGRPGEILRNLMWELAEAKDKTVWEEFARHIHEIFGIEVRKPVYSPAQPYIVCEYLESGHSRPLDLSNAGSGTLQVLLLLAFLYARPASVILVDEPDAHQHVILQKQVHDRIRKIAHDRGGQLIAATHSEVILDATAPERVLGFLGESPQALGDRSERDALREALKRVPTTDLLLGQEVRSILYVEGRTDERILSEWARRLDHPAQAFFRRPFVHCLEGRSIRRAKAHFFAMRAAVPDLQGLCLVDGDNRDEPDEETRKAGLVVMRWRRYEIENYLLHPESILRFVNFPLQQEQVESRFWGHVPKGTDLFGDHVALTRVKASDEFLTPLLRSVGEDTPRRDLYLLAAGMKEEEIHPEVREKLDRIAECLLGP